MLESIEKEAVEAKKKAVDEVCVFACVRVCMCVRACTRVCERACISVHVFASRRRKERNVALP